MTPHQVEWQRLTGLKMNFQDEKANQTYLKYIAKNLTVVLKSEKKQPYFKMNVNLISLILALLLWLLVVWATHWLVLSQHL